MRKKGHGCMSLSRKLTSLGYKVGRMGVWHWVAGHSTPPGNQVYLVAAVLGVHPKKIIELSFDPAEIEKAKLLINNQ